MIGTDIHKAIQLLQQGELVAIPTETVYGLAANAFDAGAVAKIYVVKNRPQFNPVIIHTDSLDKLRSWGLQLPEDMLKLAARFSPGPLTYVIPKSDKIPDIVTAGSDAVAVRIPNHPFTLRLLAQLAFPLAAPSANPSGFVSPTSAAHVYEQLGEQIPYILEGGECEVGVESTIISFVGERPRVLRFGGITLEQMEAVLGKVDVAKEGDKVIAPGMMLRHYGTRHRLLFGDIDKHLSAFPADRVGIISFYKAYNKVPITNQRILSFNRDAAEAAQRLFGALREMDKMDIDVILAEEFPEEGLGRAINDRLRRAAGTGV